MKNITEVLEKLNGEKKLVTELQEVEIQDPGCYENDINISKAIIETLEWLLK